MDANVLDDTRQLLEDQAGRLDPDDPWRDWLEHVAHRLDLAVDLDRAADRLDRVRLRLVR